MKSYSSAGRFVAHLVLVSLGIVGIYLFNANNRMLHTLEEERFDSWFNQTEEKLRSGEQKEAIIVELSSTDPKLQGSWLLRYDPESVEQQASGARLLGVLRLLKASRVFYETSESLPEDGFSFSIRSGTSHFASFFPASAVKKNISLKSLIVLMRDYTDQEKSISKKEKA